MYNVNKKQKIILGILTTIVAGFVCYYVYAKDDKNTTPLALKDTLAIEEEKVEEDYHENKILVHISGAVNKEGVVELTINSRIVDAIEKAGGVTEEADIKVVNLAYKLEDGMKIYIPTKEENQEKENRIKEYVTNSSGISNVNENEQEPAEAKVNINTATQTQLESLPGVGPSTASKIIAYRKEKGKFNQIEDVKKVSGIGEAKFDKIKNNIVVK